MIMFYLPLAASPLAACSPRHIWIVDPPYSCLRRSIIGLPCKIESVREKERQRERERERLSVRKRDRVKGRHIWIVDPPYSRLRRSVIGLPCKIGMKKNGIQ